MNVQFIIYDKETENTHTIPYSEFRSCYSIPIHNLEKEDHQLILLCDTSMKLLEQESMYLQRYTPNSYKILLYKKELDYRSEKKHQGLELVLRREK